MSAGNSSRAAVRLSNKQKSAVHIVGTDAKLQGPAWARWAASCAAGGVAPGCAPACPDWWAEAWCPICIAQAIWQATVALTTGKYVTSTKPSRKRRSVELPSHLNMGCPRTYLFFANHWSSWPISFCWSLMIF